MDPISQELADLARMLPTMQDEGTKLQALVLISWKHPAAINTIAELISRDTCQAYMDWLSRPIDPEVDTPAARAISMAVVAASGKAEMETFGLWMEAGYPEDGAEGICLRAAKLAEKMGYCRDVIDTLMATAAEEV